MKRAIRQHIIMNILHGSCSGEERNKIDALFLNHFARCFAKSMLACMQYIIFLQFLQEALH